MWKQGTSSIPDRDDEERCTVCHYWVKVCERPSKVFGINGGKIIKLTIKIDGVVTTNYDRGWDIEPKDEPTRLAYMLLLQNYN